MPMRIRLSRQGSKKNPFYHIVAIPDYKARDARPIEKLGEYDPIPRPPAYKPPKLDPDAPVLSSGIAPNVQGQLKPVKRLEWNSDRIRYWLSVGAQPSKPVAKMLDKAGLIPPGKFFKGMWPPLHMREQQAAQANAGATPTSEPASSVAASTPSEQAVPAGEVTGKVQAGAAVGEGAATGSIGETSAAKKSEGEKKISA